MFGWLLNRHKLLTNHKLLGRWGEKHSERFLRRKGFKRLARNFSCKTGEIDLVMVDTDGTIVFVEVKTRTDETFTQAETVVNDTKKNKLFRTARYFLSTYNMQDRPVRFDMIAIVIGHTGPEQIRYYKNVFVP